MKILFILPYVPSPIRVRPYHFIQELARRHEISVIAMGTTREHDLPSDLRRLCSQVEVVSLKLTARLQSCAVAALRGQPLQSAVCHSQEVQRRVEQIANGGVYDVVHIEHLRAARLRHAVPPTLPIVFDSVDAISLLLERTLRSSHSLRQRAVAAFELRRTRRYEAEVLRHFARVLVTSSEDAGALRALAPTAHLVVVPNGVDLEHFRPTAGPHDPATLVFSGKMSYHANVTAVLHFVREILPLIRASRPDVKLRIVGSNPPQAICALAKDPSITVTGYVPDLGATLGRATVAICPVTVKVGIQNKILEAMALGLPVVSSSEGAGGLGAVPDRDICVAENPTRFAQRVCQLLADPDLRNRIGRAGRNYVETHHRWDAASRILESVYIDAVEGPKAHSRPSSPTR